MKPFSPFSPAMIALILIIVGACVYLPYLGDMEVDLMEGRNLVTAREMVQDNHWLIPTLNGEPRLKKPPLPTYLPALAALITDDIQNLAILRFPAVLASILTLFFVYGLTKALTKDRDSALISALVLATAYVMISLGRRATWDPFTNAFMLGAIWAMVVGWAKEGKAYGWFALAGVFLGLSAMSKGPVSFLNMLLPFLVAFIICNDSRPLRAKWREAALALSVSLAISLPWPILAYLARPDAATGVILSESTSRFTKHLEPFWFYSNLPFQMGVWSLFGLVALVYPYAKKRVLNVPAYRLAFYWTLFSLLLISVLPEKKTRFTSPTIIAYSICIGIYIRGLIQRLTSKETSRSDVWIFRIHTIGMGAAAILLPWTMYNVQRLNADYPLMALTSWIVFSVLISIALFISLSPQKAHRVIPLTIALVCGLVVTFGPINPTRKQHKNPHNLRSDYRSFQKLGCIQNILPYPVYMAEGMDARKTWKFGCKMERLGLSHEQLKGKTPCFVLLEHPISPEASKVFNPRLIDRLPWNKEDEKSVLYIYFIAKATESDAEGSNILKPLSGGMITALNSTVDKFFMETRSKL